MRKSILPLSLALIASAALAQDPPPPQERQATPSPAAKAATKELTAQVVSTDPTAKTITVKKEGAAGDPMTAAAETTLPVEAEAVADLKTITPGEKVKLVCKTDSAGKETAVTVIKKVEKEK
jgi:hypothetical protein